MPGTLSLLSRLGFEPCVAYEHARAARGGVGEVRVVQREHELEHVPAVEQRLVEGGAQPLLQQREQPEPLLALRWRARVEVREEERHLVQRQKGP